MFRELFEDAACIS